MTNYFAETFDGLASDIYWTMLNGKVHSFVKRLLFALCLFMTSHFIGEAVAKRI